VVYNPGLNTLPFSVEFWVQPTTAEFTGFDSTGACPLSNFNPNNYPGGRVGWLFYLAPTGRWNLRLGLSSGYAVNIVATTGLASAGVWQHMAATYDGSVVKLYANGVQIGSANSLASATGWVPNTGSFLRFGGTPLPGDNAYTTDDGNYYLPWDQGATVSGNRGWDGLLDEVAIYTNVLSADTIAAHYSAATTNTAGYDAQILAANPSGYWNFDEATVTAPDPSTYPFAANSGTLGSAADGTNAWGATAAQPGTGYSGFAAGNKAVTFDGMNGTFTVKDAPGLHFTGNITLAAWVKPTANNYVHDIISHGPNGIGAATFLCINRGDVYGSGHYYEVGTTEGAANDGFYDAVEVPMPPGDIGNWVFLAGTFDGAHWNLYRNGVLAGQIPPYVGGSTDTGAIDVTNAWAIGSRSLPTEADGNRFAGSIDEPAIFNTALSASDILALYNAAQVPPVITRAVVNPGIVFKGASVSFSIWADGSGPLTYSWTSNGIPLGVTATNLTLNNLGLGTYTIAVTVNNAYGTASSTVTFPVIAAPPTFVVAPQPISRYTGRPFTFSITAAGSTPMSIQWNKDGSAISGATTSTYSGTVNSGTAGSYSCTLSNEAGQLTSTPVPLTSIPLPTGYAGAVLADTPLAYWRLGEASGTIAHDYYDGFDGTYFNATLGVQGYSVIDSDTAVAFSGINSYAGNISGTSINFPGHSVFTLEAWVNGPAGQSDEATIIAKGIGATGTTRTEQFALDVAGGKYRFFTTGGNTLYEADAGIGPNGTWQHIVGVYDDQNSLGSGTNMYLYVNGELQATAKPRPAGVNGTTSVVSIGSKRTGNDPTYDGTFNGSVDEVAVYNYALSAAKVSVHYAAAYGPSLPPVITVEPQSVTNYAGLKASFFIGAGGTQPLTYQWKKGGSPLSDTGNISGSAGDTLTIYPLGLGDAGDYSVTINNVNGTTNSVTVHLAVLAPPTSAPSIPGLVVHLPFNGSLADVTGRGNNAVGIHINRNLGVTTSNTVAPTYVPDGMPLGHQAFHFSTTDIDGNGTNFDNFYATFGRDLADLHFSSNVNFSVALWIRPPINYVLNDLPYLCNGANSTFATPGIVFAYTYGVTVGSTPGYPGGWAYSVLDAGGAGLGGRGELGSINDGYWHHLVHVFDRKNGAATYLDGLPVVFHKQQGTSIQAAGSFDTGEWFTIGQDPTGLYASATAGFQSQGVAGVASGDIADLGVWKAALTPLQAAAIYVGAVSNNLSFAGGPIPPLQAQALPGNKVQLTWSVGTLQSAPVVTGPYADIPQASSPWVVTNSPTKFYRSRL
jgi:hypothetical protein